jgi:hypothetical protein
MPERREPVAGTVEVMTDTPVVIPANGTLRDRIDEARERHPWVLPAGLLLVIALLVAMRRR